eukprot:6428385-Prymnesium_polylepis.1
MVPPVDVFFRGRYDGKELRRSGELVIKAHAVTLVSDHANPGAPIFRTDDISFTYPPGDRRATAPPTRR